MSDSGVRERPGRPPQAGGPVFDLLASKLRRPVVQPGAVLRLPLTERLARGEPRPIVSVVAPPGYGKTTLLSHWAEHSSQQFAWVSVDEQDNDPRVLLTYVARALDAIQPVGGRVFDALASAVSSVPGSVVPRLGSAFWSMTAPVVLVLDDVHLLRDACLFHPAQVRRAAVAGASSWFSSYQGRRTYGFSRFHANGMMRRLIS